MFSTIQSDERLDAFQRQWVRVNAAEDKNNIRTPQSMVGMIYLICGIVAPLGMFYRGFVNPEYINPSLTNFIFFASIVYIGMLMLHGLGLGLKLVLSGAIAVKVDEAKAVAKEDYTLLKAISKSYSSTYKIVRLRFKQLMSILFLIGLVVVGGNWSWVAALVVLPCIGWIFFCQRASRNAAVNTLRHLTREVAEDYDAGRNKPTQTLIVEAVTIRQEED